MHGLYIYNHIHMDVGGGLTQSPTPQPVKHQTVSGCLCGWCRVQLMELKESEDEINGERSE